MKEPIIIAFFIQDEIINVCNPCAIPIELIESAIKEHKQRKDKKLVTHIFNILIPIGKIPIKRRKTSSRRIKR